MIENVISFLFCFVFKSNVGLNRMEAMHYVAGVLFSVLKKLVSKFQSKIKRNYISGYMHFAILCDFFLSLLEKNKRDNKVLCMWFPFLIIVKLVDNNRLVS